MSSRTTPKSQKPNLRSVIILGVITSTMINIAEARHWIYEYKEEATQEYEESGLRWETTLEYEESSMNPDPYPLRWVYDSLDFLKSHRADLIKAGKIMRSCQRGTRFYLRALH